MLPKSICAILIFQKEEWVTPRDVSSRFHKKHMERSGLSVGFSGSVGSVSKFNHSSPSVVPGEIAQSLQT